MLDFFILIYMALKTKVKVNHITNLSDARYCAGMGVHYLGFSFIIGDDTYIDPEKYNEIKTWISGPEFVAEFNNADISYIKNILSRISIDLIETNQPDILNQLGLIGKPIILKLDLAKYQSFEDLRGDLSYANDMVELFIIENTSKNTEIPDFIRELASSFRLLLGFNIDKTKIQTIIDETAIYGIVLQGGKEEQVGFKDYDELADILELIEIE